MATLNQTYVSTDNPTEWEPFPIENVIEGDPDGKVSWLRQEGAGDGMLLAGVFTGQPSKFPYVFAGDETFHVLEGETSADNVAAIGTTLRKMLGLDVDSAPFFALAKSQRHLAPIAAALRGMRPPRFANLFEAFANVIPFQQVSLQSGIATVRKMVERFGESVEHEGARYFAFPEARVIAESRQASLRACGFSERKAEALRFIAGKIDRGELTEKMLTRMPSTDALERLMELPSIGPWSAGLVLLRGLGRVDVFPQGDVGATKGLSTLMHVPPGPKLERLAERFGDVRGYLYFSALGASLLAKGLIHPAPLEGGHKSAARNVEESAHPAL